MQQRAMLEKLALMGSVRNLRSSPSRGWLSARVISCRALAAAVAAFALPVTFLHQIEVGLRPREEWKTESLVF